MKEIIFLCGIYFFVYICVYSVHNYMQSMLSDTQNIKPEQYATLDMLLIIKFVGAFIFTNIADRTKRHDIIMIVGLLGYGLFLYLMVAVKCEAGEVVSLFSKLRVALCYFFSTFFLSGVFPAVDSTCLNYLESVNKEKNWYGRIKMGGCLGVFCAHLCIQLVNTGESYFNTKTAPAVLSSIFSVVASIFIYISFKVCDLEKKKTEVIEKPSIKERLRKNILNVKELVGINIALLLCAVTLQGIHRHAVSTYLETYYRQNGFQRKEVASLNALRCAPDCYMYFAAPDFDETIGITWMMFLGILIGTFRPLSYSFIDLKSYSLFQKYVWIYTLEISKGIFSSLFGYSATKLVKKMATPETRALAQGLFNGCYSGLAPFITGLMGFWLLYDNEDSFEVTLINFFKITGLLGLIGLLFISALLIRGNKSLKAALK